MLRSLVLVVAVENKGEMSKLMRALILALLLCACTPQVATYPGPMREVWGEKT